LNGRFRLKQTFRNATSEISRANVCYALESSRPGDKLLAGCY
jgi:hypothetical protein